MTSVMWSRREVEGDGLLPSPFERRPKTTTQLLYTHHFSVRALSIAIRRCRVRGREPSS